MNNNDNEVEEKVEDLVLSHDSSEGSRYAKPSIVMEDDSDVIEPPKKNKTSIILVAIGTIIIIGIAIFLAL